jgi:hypothetical protein
VSDTQGPPSKGGARGRDYTHAPQRLVHADEHEACEGGVWVGEGGGGGGRGVGRGERGGAEGGGGVWGGRGVGGWVAEAQCGMAEGDRCGALTTCWWYLPVQVSPQRYAPRS